MSQSCEGPAEGKSIFKPGGAAKLPGPSYPGAAKMPKAPTKNSIDSPAPPNVYTK